MQLAYEFFHLGKELDNLLTENKKLEKVKLMNKLNLNIHAYQIKSKI